MLCNLLICYWLLFTSIMFRIFESVFTGDFGLQFSYSAFGVGSKAILIIFCPVLWHFTLYMHYLIIRKFQGALTEDLVLALFLHGSLLPGIHPYFFLPPYLPEIYYIFSTQPGLLFLFSVPLTVIKSCLPEIDDLELASLIFLLSVSTI